MQRRSFLKATAVTAARPASIAVAAGEAELYAAGELVAQALMAGKTVRIAKSVILPAWFVARATFG